MKIALAHDDPSINYNTGEIEVLRAIASIYEVFTLGLSDRTFDIVP